MDSDTNSFLARFEDAIGPHNDGSTGQYRGPAEFNISGANTDKEAIAAFLSQYKKSPATERTYIKETERFHMWAILRLNKSITDLTLEDYQSYIDFLANPDNDWISEAKVPKNSPEWRPFTFIPNTGIASVQSKDSKKEVSRGLSHAAVQLAVASINSMLSWMVDAGYLRINPLKILRQKDKAIGTNINHAESKKIDRFLDEDMWAAAKKSVDLMPVSKPNEIIIYERIRFILTMFSMVGARVSELSNAQMNDVRREPGGWFWNVIGKGQKVDKVTVPQDMIDSLIRWRTSLGLSPLPSQDENIPIIPSINKSGKPIYTKTIKKLNADGTVSLETVPRHGLSSRRINELLKEVFIRASQDPALTADRKIALEKASAHWLRHTAITQKIDAGMDRFLVQKDARHADMKTTNRYIHDEERERTNEAKKHRLQWE